MGVVLSERVDGLLREYRLDEVEAVADLNPGDCIIEEHFDRLFELVWELSVKVAVILKVDAE